MKKLSKEYRNMGRKKLKKQLLHQMQCNIQIVGDNRNIVQTNTRLEQHIESAENALVYKEKVIEKYKDLLSHSVENL